MDAPRPIDQRTSALMLDGFGTVWIDMTDLVGWRGHLTGIQRVEFNLAIRFAELSNVRFFSVADGPPVESDFGELLEHLEGEMGPVADDEDSATVAGPVRSAPRRLAKQAIGTALDHLPGISKPQMITAYDKVAHEVKLNAAKVKAKKAGRGRASESSINFEHGDLVLVLGGNWGRAGYIGRIGRAIRRTDGIRFGHVIFDVIPAVNPGFFPDGLVKEFRRYLQFILEDAAICIAISQHTRNDVLAFALAEGIKPPPVHTFRLGDDIGEVAAVRPEELKLAPSTPFIFCPGTVEVRKNHQILYHAYRLAHERGFDLPHLVIAGKVGWLASEVAYLLDKDPVMSGQVTMLSECRDNEFAWLYKNCAFTIYPSVYEGWGLPVAESLKYGKLCLASHASSIPEVGGDLVEYLSPNDSAQVAELIHRFGSDPELVAKREDQIRQNYRPVSWDVAFEDVIAAIDLLPSALQRPRLEAKGQQA